MLSKSRFLAGTQCHLRLWYQCYNRELASEVTPAQKAIFDTGHEVGRLATGLFPGGILIEEDHPFRRFHDPLTLNTLLADDTPFRHNEGVQLHVVGHSNSINIVFELTHTLCDANNLIKLSNLWWLVYWLKIFDH